MVVDDDPGILVILDRFAKRLGFDVVGRAGGRDALAALADARPDVALVDVFMSEGGGLHVLRTIRDVHSDCQVILMTARPCVDTAIEAIKLGALDYVSKPFDFSRLTALLTGVRTSIERREQLLNADANIALRFEFCGMIGRGPAMQELFDTIRRVAPHVQTMLVTGETGTGKELVVRALHTLAAAPNGRLVTVNCPAVVESSFETELFGRARGAFTGAADSTAGLFEQADGGTLFLDEIGGLPLTLQSTLLRAVDQRTVQRVGSFEGRTIKVRIVGATNRNLRAEVADGRFRRDLFDRLAIVEIQIIPLRERREDIPYLTAAFLRACAARLNKTVTGVTPFAERLLQNAPWPGNVRELRNAIERACILSDGRILSEGEVAAAMSAAPLDRDALVIAALRSGDDPTLMSNGQRDHVERVLRQVGGDKSAAARLLGISRRSVYRRLERQSAPGRPKPHTAVRP
jgi:two-component system response regulator HydG